MKEQYKLAKSQVEAWQNNVPTGTHLQQMSAGLKEAKRIVADYETRYITATVDKNGKHTEIRTDAQELRELRKLTARIERVADREGWNLGNPAEHLPYARITHRIYILTH